MSSDGKHSLLRNRHVLRGHASSRSSDVVVFRLRHVHHVLCRLRRLGRLGGRGGRFLISLRDSLSHFLTLRGRFFLSSKHCSSHTRVSSKSADLIYSKLFQLPRHKRLFDESDDEGTFDHLPLSAMGNSSSASDPFGGTRLSLSSTGYSTIASGDVKIALADPTEKQKVVEPSVEKLV